MRNNDPFDDPFFDDGESSAASGVAAVIALQFVVIGGALIGFVGAAYLTWTYAPAVGGEWWPYIRALAALIGGAIGAKVIGIVAYVVGMIFVGPGAWLK